MSTNYPEIFHELSEPFDEKHEVKVLPKGNGIKYVTARTVMNRLDKILGPENWWDEYIPQANCVICKLTICLPDGSVITKCDAGGHAGMSDEGDDEKSGYSDAFKRAAVKFGVGRHLYGSGIPKFLDEPVQQPQTQAVKRPSQARPDHAKPADVAAEMKSYDGPRTTAEFMAFLRSIDADGTEGHIEFIKAWGTRKGFPSLIGKWTNEQTREAYPVLARQLEAERALQPA